METPDPAAPAPAPAPAPAVMAIGPTIVIHELAEKLGVKVTELIAQLMKNGVMATINDTIDFETAAVVGSDLGFALIEQSAAAKMRQPKTSSLGEQNEVQRPPVVAVMGHVDHGKTSLLDAIRKSKVAAAEAGGITQHLSAYQIEYKNRLITFLDTPGHEAFSLLRQRGAHLTDLAIIVVAADDGIKPQTEEAIAFAQKAGVKIIVALTKVDKPGIDLTRVKQQLSDKGLTPEEWNGDTVTVEVSAKTGQNLNKLLDLILLVADIEELTARASGPATGIVIEAHMVVGHGPVATLLVEQGRLKIGDFLIAGSSYGKIRRLSNSNNEPTQTASPSEPVVMMGWKSLPDLGTPFEVVSDEKAARVASQASRRVHSVQTIATAKKMVGSESLASAIEAQKINYLPVVVKADVHGSLEAVVDGLKNLGDEEVKVKIVSQGVGNISESDVSLAASTGADILGFNITLPVAVKRLSQREQVSLDIYRIIYELLDDVQGRLSQRLRPETVEEEAGRLNVKGVFKITKNSLICGGLVTAGKITPGLLVRKAGEEESLGTLKNLQRQQQAVKEVKADEMCGLEISTSQKAAVALEDKLEFFSRETKARTL